MKMRRVQFSRWIFSASFIILTQHAHAQQSQNIGGVEVLHVKGPIFMFTTGGANITASIGPDGVLLVDTGPAETGDKLKTAIAEVQKQVTMARALTAAPPLGGAETKSATQTMLFTYNTPKPSTDPVRFIMNTSGRTEHIGARQWRRPYRQNS